MLLLKKLEELHYEVEQQTVSLTFRSNDRHQSRKLKGRTDRESKIDLGFVKFDVQLIVDLYTGQNIFIKNKDDIITKYKKYTVL